MSTKVVAILTSTPEDMDNITDTINSLIFGSRPPEEIVIALPLTARYKIPAALRHSERIRLERTDYDFGSLTGLACALELYDDRADIQLMLVSSTMRYPKNIVQEFLAIRPELEKQLASKLPQYTSSIWGTGGTVMVQNKERDMDRELEALMAGHDIAPSDNRTIIGYVRENATVDILETHGVIWLNRQQVVKSDFMQMLKKYGDGLVKGLLCGDTLLSNYMASRNIFRTQICTLTLNRYLLEVGGFSDHRRRRTKQAKEIVVANTVKLLQSNGSFHIWATAANS